MVSRRSEKLLEIKKLSVDFMRAEKSVRVLDRVDLSLNKGETLALVGSSGSGKTLTALSILQLLPHSARISQESQVLWKGNDLLNQTQIQMRGFAACAYSKHDAVLLPYTQWS